MYWDLLIYYYYLLTVEFSCANTIFFAELQVHLKQVGVRFGMENRQGFTYWLYIMHGRCMF